MSDASMGPFTVIIISVIWSFGAAQHRKNKILMKWGMNLMFLVRQ
jgi:hypothetical protein